MHLITLAASLFSLAASADIRLPPGVGSGCPFVHQDAYDLGGALELLKNQIAEKANGDNACQAAVRSIYSGLSSIQNFTRDIDPATSLKIARGVYESAALTLTTDKARFEAAGDRSSGAYQTTVANLAKMSDALQKNEIDSASISATTAVTYEAYYRNQLLTQTTALMTAYSNALRSSPDCINRIGSWNSVLSGVLGAFSIATGASLNPMAVTIGAAASASAQLVNLLQDTRVRRAYNEITKLENAQTLACTYYGLKKTTCDYQRAYRSSLDYAKIKRMWTGNFPTTGRRGEFEKYFYIRGGLARIGDALAKITQMGSPLTLNTSLLVDYIVAKKVQFDLLPPLPSPTASDLDITRWLKAASNLGIIYQTRAQNGELYTARDSLGSAIKDRDQKLATISFVESTIVENVSFLDLKRRVVAQDPYLKRLVFEMLGYLQGLAISPLVNREDRVAIDPAITLLTKMATLLAIDSQTRDFEQVVNRAGLAIFQEIAKGSVAQISDQSILAIVSRGQDRISWGFDAIRNAFIRRDVREAIPSADRFVTFQNQGAILADLKENYLAFSGPGATFRAESQWTAVTSFEKAFGREVVKSIRTSMDTPSSVPQLKGTTAAHLCALYASSLRRLSDRDVLAKRTLDECLVKYRTLEYNRLVTSTDFPVDYANDCTYLNYTRQIEIQQLEAELL